MLRLPQIFLTLLVLYSGIKAQQRFIDPGEYPLSTRTLSEKYCTRIDKDHSFCEGKKLSYLDTNVSDLPAFLKGAHAFIDPILSSYRKNNLKKEVFDTIKELSGDVSGEWYGETRIELFAKTPATYTLSVGSNGYTGGAHGYDTVGYTNVAIATQKKLTLRELFLPGTEEKLKEIAQTYYRLEHNLKPKQPLIDDDWFENRFVLAENFAITPYGLHFLYNQYEIKPYAAGQTSFFLPYGAIGDLIDPRGPLAFALKQPKSKTAATYESEQMRLSLEAWRKDDRIMIRAHLTPLVTAKRIWLTLSLPQIPSKSYLTGTGYEGFDRLIPYDGGNRIYNRRMKKEIPARYLLVEGEKANPRYDHEYIQWFRIKVPPKLKNLIIDIRATLQSHDRTYRLPDDYEGITGEQGYRNYRVILPL